MAKMASEMGALLLLSGLTVTAQVPPKAGVVAPPKVAPPPVPAPSATPALSSSQQQQLQALVAQHQRIRAQLPTTDAVILDGLVVRLRQELFAAPLRGNLLVSASRIVGRAIPGLTEVETTALAEYGLGGIAVATASGGQAALLAATKQMQETQMSFNLQYLQLQSQMQHENRAYTAISNIMKTKHDTVKNSISNVR